MINDCAVFREFIQFLLVFLFAETADVKYDFTRREIPAFAGMYGAMQGVAKKEKKKAKKMPDGPEKENKLKGAEFLKIILDSNSIISLSMSSSGAFPYNFALGFVDLSNGHLIRGIKDFTKKIDAPKLPIEMEEKKNG